MELRQERTRRTHDLRPATTRCLPTSRLVSASGHAPRPSGRRRSRAGGLPAAAPGLEPGPGRPLRAPAAEAQEPLAPRRRRPGRHGPRRRRRRRLRRDPARRRCRRGDLPRGQLEHRHGPLREPARARHRGDHELDRHQHAHHPGCQHSGPHGERRPARPLRGHAERRAVRPRRPDRLPDGQPGAGRRLRVGPQPRPDAAVDRRHPGERGPAPELHPRAHLGHPGQRHPDHQLRLPQRPAHAAPGGAPGRHRGDGRPLRGSPDQVQLRQPAHPAAGRGPASTPPPSWWSTRPPWSSTCSSW